MKSIGQMLEQISGLVGTSDLNEWETKFIDDMYVKYIEYSKTTNRFSFKQCEIIERIYKKHFA